MKKWIKILFVVMLVSGVLTASQIYMLWQWDHTVAPFCWNPFVVVNMEIRPSHFFVPYLDDWISWLPPQGWKTGVYCYNFLMASMILLSIAQFLTPPIIVILARKKID